MGKELAKEGGENTRALGSQEPADDLTDIDPADFVDPEEFGYRRLHLHE